MTYWTLVASHGDGKVIPISNHWKAEQAETWAERSRNRRNLRGKWQIADAIAGLGFAWHVIEMPGKPSDTREAAAERQHIAKHGWTPVGSGRGLPDRLYLDKDGKPVWVEIKPRKRNGRDLQGLRLEQTLVMNALQDCGNACYVGDGRELLEEYDRAKHGFLP